MKRLISIGLLVDNTNYNDTHNLYVTILLVCNLFLAEDWCSAVVVWKRMHIFELWLWYSNRYSLYSLFSNFRYFKINNLWEYHAFHWLDLQGLQLCIYKCNTAMAYTSHACISCDWIIYCYRIN